MAMIVLGSDLSTATRVVSYYRRIAAPLCVLYSMDENGVITPPEEIIDLDGTTDFGNNMFFNTYKGCKNITDGVDFDSLQHVSGEYACYSMFADCTHIPYVDLSNLEDVTGQWACHEMFAGCTGITSIDLGKLTSIGVYYGCGRMFRDCTGLTSVDLGSLEEIVGGAAALNMFSGCTNIETINVDNLRYISGQITAQNMFYGCEKLTSVNFKSLATVADRWCLGWCFSGCTNLKHIYFPALTPQGVRSNNALRRIIQNVDGCTLHFQDGMQSTIAAHDSYPDFAGTNTTILFDL